MQWTALSPRLVQYICFSSFPFIYSRVLCTLFWCKWFFFYRIMCLLIELCTFFMSFVHLTRSMTAKKKRSCVYPQMANTFLPPLESYDKSLMNFQSSTLFHVNLSHLGSLPAYWFIFLVDLACFKHFGSFYLYNFLSNNFNGFTCCIWSCDCSLLANQANVGPLLITRDKRRLKKREWLNNPVFM